MLRTLYLWPCNVTAWQCWQGVRTQWREGMAGRTGLDYAGVRAYLDLQLDDPQQRREAFDGIRACEAATLEAWADQRDK